MEFRVRLKMILPQIVLVFCALLALSLSWDNNPIRKEWSSYLSQSIDAQFKYLDKAEDISDFCPNYSVLNKEEKIKVWSELFIAMAYYESNWIPTMRYREDSLGIDSVTGQQVYSEGLLQLSYQDVKNIPWIKANGCLIDWKKDKDLNPLLNTKTIFNPEINLNCGVLIMANQIKSRRNILLTSGAYWSVIKINSNNSKIYQITERLSKLKICN